MNALCPDCKEERGDVVSREVKEQGGVLVAYECPHCSNEWDVLF